METNDIKITAAGKKKATDAIEAIHAAYFEPAGIRDTEEKLEAMRSSCSQHAYDLAAYAVKTSAGDMAEGAQLFSALCEYAEGRYKERHAVENLKDALPTWAVFKSNILRGMRLGLDPGGYGSEYEFRKAVMEAVAAGVHEVPPPASGALQERYQERRAAKQAPAPERREEKRQDPLWLEDAEVMIADFTTVAGVMRGLVARLLVEVEFIKPSRQEDAEGVIRRAIQELQPMIDMRKIRDEATKTALKAAA